MDFLLDTNVISELRKRSAAEQVVEWARSYKLSQYYISVITLMEIRSGTEKIRKKDPAFSKKLDKWYALHLLPVYERRILPVTLPICEIRASFPPQPTRPDLDMLIAATAKYHNLTVATRNLTDFQGLGIRTVNPWNH